MAIGGQESPLVDTFIQSASFIGPRQGYFFGTGALGTGYYRLSNSEDQERDHGRVSKRKRDIEPLHGEELLELVERQAGRVVKEIDGAALERLLRSLEKKFNVNVERRIQYANEPPKFMESEMELDEAVKSLRVRFLIAYTSSLGPCVLWISCLRILV